jgi:hypothetical protein
MTTDGDRSDLFSTTSTTVGLLCRPWALVALLPLVFSGFELGFGGSWVLYLFLTYQKYKTHHSLWSVRAQVNRFPRSRREDISALLSITLPIPFVFNYLLTGGLIISVLVSLPTPPHFAKSNTSSCSATNPNLAYSALPASDASRNEGRLFLSA